MSRRRHIHRLPATVDVFGSQELAEQALEVVINALLCDVDRLVADPLSSRALDEPRKVLQRELLERAARVGRRRFLRPTEVTFPIGNSHERHSFARWAYWSDLADVWSLDQQELFEAADGGLAANYYLTDAQRDAAENGLRAAGLHVPRAWRAQDRSLPGS